MPVNDYDSKELKYWGVQANSSRHGTLDEVTTILDAQKDRGHGKWVQRGNEIHCNNCSTGHGFIKLPFDEGKHWILVGDDENGHPKFREIIPKEPLLDPTTE